MPPILVEPLSAQAYELLRHLEAMHILRVLPEASVSAPAKPSVAALVGSLSDETAAQMRAETTQMRNEWERAF